MWGWQEHVGNEECSSSHTSRTLFWAGLWGLDIISSPPGPNEKAAVSWLLQNSRFRLDFTKLLTVLLWFGSQGCTGEHTSSHVVYNQPRLKGDSGELCNMCKCPDFHGAVVYNNPRVPCSLRRPMEYLSLQSG